MRSLSAHPQAPVRRAGARRGPRRAVALAPALAAPDLTELLRALAHPLRLGILLLLRGRALRVGDLHRQLAAEQAIVSQQLRILRLAGLVETHCAPDRSVYQLTPTGLPGLLDAVERFGDRRARARSNAPGASRARRTRGDRR